MYGHCKNCWWCKILHGEGYQVTSYRLVKTEAQGICYYQTVNPCTDIEERHYVNGDSYCPQYCNRERTNKRDKQTLEKWLNELKKKQKEV